MLEKNPKKRISIMEIFSHEWFAKNSSKIENKNLDFFQKNPFKIENNFEQVLNYEWSPEPEILIKQDEDLIIMRNRNNQFWKSNSNSNKKIEEKQFTKFRNNSVDLLSSQNKLSHNQLLIPLRVNFLLFDFNILDFIIIYI